MAKPKHKEIIEHFIQTFRSEDTLTPSEYKMLSIKLSGLKKTVKTFLVENNIDTDKSVEEIIWETIDYCALTGKKFKSIASLGYSDLPKSIEYWKKRELFMQQKEEEEKQKQKQTEDEKKLEKMVAENMEKRKQKKVPKWLMDD